VLAWLQDLALQEESEKEKENNFFFHLIDFRSIIQET